MNKPAVQVVWFKRDLRVVDHRPLSRASALGHVLPLLVVEPDWWRQPDMSARQFLFYRECALELTDSLAALGQPLDVRIGDVVECLTVINNTFQVAGLWSHEETGNDWTFQRDLRVADWCRQNSVTWTELRQHGVIRRLKTRDGWAGKWDKLMAEPITEAPSTLAPLPCGLETTALPTPKVLGLVHDEPPLRQPGGRTRATSTLTSFLQERGEPYRSAMSSPSSGEHACSRLSPYLAWGAVSMREVAQTTWNRQWELKQIGGKAVSQWRASLVSFTGRLHWHCHFMQKLEDEPRLEFQNLHPAYDGLRAPSESEGSRLGAWQNGETGLPFLDACMRYLAATGWLNFRIRAMLMATASYHLWLHWREPGLHLARQFTDYEPGIHWPQAQMQSGTTGINTVRIYNPIKQGYDQDPDGAFVRRWVPELAAIEDSTIHEPWKSPVASRILDKTYPSPIVDHMQAARDARQKIYGARKGAAFRKAAGAIQSKHGSRKSGIRVTGRKSGKRERLRSEKVPVGQLAMELGPIGNDDKETGR
ncbi:MAG: deoxyribodipyrimidine photo-lyase/cryptochrome family protein [Hyphomicrobiaceae bacterium]